jgi:hypothetical protein
LGTRRLVGAGGLQACEAGKGAVEVAGTGIDAALEAGEGFRLGGCGLGERAVLVGVQPVLLVKDPELGLGFMEAAEEPIGVDEGIDEAALLGSGGLEALEIFGGEGFEIGGIFAGNDERLGVDAGLQRIHAGGGLAADRARAGGFLGVAAVGFELFEGGHCVLPNDEGSRAAGGAMGSGIGK